MSQNQSSASSSSSTTVDDFTGQSIDPADLDLPIEPNPTGKTYRGPVAVTHVHRAMVDAILAYPAITNRELAEMFGYSPSWVGMVLQSPLFKNVLEKRRNEVINPIIVATTEERLKAVVDRSLDVIHEKLSKDVDKVNDALVLRALEIGAKALGMGQPKKEDIVVDVSHLDNLAKRLVALKPRDTGQGVVYEAENLEGQNAQAR